MLCEEAESSRSDRQRCGTAEYNGWQKLEILEAAGVPSKLDAQMQS